MFLTMTSRPAPIRSTLPPAAKPLFAELRQVTAVMQIRAARLDALVAAARGGK